MTKVVKKLDNDQLRKENTKLRKMLSDFTKLFTVDIYQGTDAEVGEEFRRLMRTIVKEHPSLVDSLCRRTK